MIGIRHMILALLALVTFSGNAQVELYADTVVGDVGNQVVVPVRVNNFTDLISMQGTVHFDPTVASYAGVEQFALPGLSLGSFGTTQSALGNITFSWFDGDLSGENLANGDVVFALRLDLIGSPGDSSFIWFDDSPTPLEFVNDLFTIQPYAVDTGLVIVDGQPAVSGLTLWADSVVANQNDTVLMPIRVKDFEIIRGVQGTIGFDPAVADYINVEQFGVPGMSSANFGETQVDMGNLMFSWNSPTQSGENLPDSAILFSIRYHVIGPGGSDTDISFLGAPTPMEIVDSNLTILNPYLEAGHIDVAADTNAVFALLIDTVVGMQTQPVNVPIRAWAFNDILSMQGTFSFDTSVISYSSVTNFNLPDLSMANFGTTQVNDGRLSFSWFDLDLLGENFADSAILFEIVFNCDGNIGDFGEVILTSDLTPIEVVEVGNLVIPYWIDSGGVLIDSLGAFINANDPLDLTYCAGDSIGLIYQTSISPSSGNIFTLELSDETGSFASPVAIGTLASTLDSALISGIIPNGTPYGTGYKLRVNSSLPTLLGNETSANITIEYYEDSVASVICFGDSLFVGGNWQDTPGFYADTLASVNGCDSVIVTNLSFTSAIADSVYLDICQGDSVFLQGDWQMAAGWYVDSLVAQSGCDSLIRTNVTVFNVFNTPISASICAEDSIFLENAWQNSAGVYVDSLLTINGCDSLITTTLSLYPSDTVNLTLEVCAGDSALLGGSYQTVSGSYTDTYTSIFGCDSTVITAMTVLPLNETFDTVAVCFGDSLFTGGAWQTLSGDYIDSLLAINGCDSLHRINLTIKDEIRDTLYTSICQGDSLFVQGDWQQFAGPYTDSLIAADGCDSVVVTQLSVINEVTTFDALTICDGDSLLIHGIYQSMAGTYVDTLLSQAGCDSIATFDLSVEVHPLYTDAVQICVGDSAFLGGMWQMTSGVYTDTFPSNLGCDSIIQTTLNVINTIQTFETASICLGDSVFLENNWQTTAGVYDDTLVAAAGCDSIVTTTLTVLLPSAGSDNLTICSGDSVMIGGIYQSVGGNYPDTLIAVNGCDSIVDVLLTVNPTYFIEDSIGICQGDSVFLEGAYQTTSGFYTDSYSTIFGCDSIIETELVVSPVTMTNLSVTICSGDSALIHGIYQSTAGNYLDTLASVAGCDSIIDVLLNVDPSYFIQNSLTICQGDSALLDGAYQTTSGVYTDFDLTVLGCDSIIETTLTVTPAPVFNETISICDGDSVLVNGTYLSLAGTYSDTLSAVNGCDSIAETLIVVNPTYLIPESLTICQGDSALLGGTYQLTSGVYQDVLATTLGCDSIIETTLTVTPAPVYFESITICQGDSAMINGVYENTSGTYPNTYQAVNGCDSIVETTLTVNPAPTYFNTIEICQGDSALVNGNYENTAGSYVATLTAANGCDSISDITLIVNPTYFSQDALTICQGDSVLLEGMYQMTSGTYTDTVFTVSGCDSIIETMLTVDPAITGTDDITICDGDSVLVNGIYLSSAGSYVDTVQAANGCDSIVTTNISVTVIDNSVTVNSPTLTANYAGAQSYQWINCDSGNNIGNGTAQSYTAVSNGSYQVQITDQGCEVLSECENINDVSLDEFDLTKVLIYPNPTPGLLTVEHEYPDANMILRDMYGKELLFDQVDVKFTISLEEYPVGVYFLELEGHTFKIVKQ